MGRTATPRSHDLDQIKARGIEMETCSRRIVGAALLAASLWAVPWGAARAERFPERPVMVVNPFPAGGSLDNLLRLLAQKVTESMGQPMLVENRPGASSIIGSGFVARAKPDGYTLLAQSTNFTIAPAVGVELPYDTEKSFEPVTLLAAVPQVLAVPAASAARSVKDLVEQAKGHPGSVTYGTLGPGTGGHMTGEAFQRSAGITLSQIPFRGSSQTLQALAGGHIGMAFGNLPEILEYEKGGLVRPLAIAADKRSALAPTLPTMAEAGYPGVISEPWYGILAPAGTPAAIVDRLQVEFAKALRQPDVAQRLRELGIRTVASTPQEFRQYISGEIRQYGKLAKEANISLK
ncbi:hypothetical protein CAL26_22475 [Bordetella genomosp. 9]|uniref:LacI family transcriptional regulator n=1 Tax=Bordetella genomosp. 9 TaxID=1416803 RepID=A0A261R6U1_9BORD|nr:hypothetical protein CAL26_22475 [Bordetella genomosp. 9]